MTVKELIEELSKYPQDIEVVMDKYKDSCEEYYFIDEVTSHNGKLHLYEL